MHRGALVLAMLLAPTVSAASELDLPVQQRVLDNGLTVLVLEDHAIPNAALYVGWRVGSRNERPGTTGLAHFFEHMMFSSGARFGGRFDTVMEANGGANNAFTSRDVTVYTDWFPAARLPLILAMEADRMRALALDAELVEREREVVASERRLSMEEPAAALEEQLWATAYTAHPYQWDVLGWMVDIQNWRQEDLEAFFAAHYVPANAVLAIVGDVGAGAAFEAVAAAMGSLEARPLPRPVHTAEPPQRGERRVVLEAPGAGLAQVVMAWHVPAARAPETPALWVLEELLLGGRSSRLHRLLVEEEQLCLEVGGGWQGPSFDPTLFTVSLQLRDGVDAAAVEARVEVALAELAEEGPRPEELFKAQNTLIAGLLRRLQTIDGKAELITEAELFHGGWRELTSRPERLRAVEGADVQGLVRRLLTRRNRTVATLDVSEPAAGEPPEAAAPAVAADAEDDVEAAADESAGERGDERAPIAAPEPLAIEVRLPPRQLHTLKNGLRVLLVPRPGVPLVHFQARLLGGALEDPAGQEGATALLAALLLKGAGERDAAAFQEALERAGGTSAAGVSTRWARLELELPARDRALGLELLADALRRPRLDPAELTRERGLALDALAAARDEPNEVIATYWRSWLFRGHPFARPPGGSEGSLARVDAEAIRAAAARVLAPERTWLAVSGAFEPAAMLSALEAAFGDWKAADDPEAADPPKPTRAEEARVLLVDKPDALQTYFRFGELGFDWSDPDYPARALANTVFGGRFTSRFNTALRIEGGLSYGAYSGFDDTLAGAFAARSYTSTATSRQALELARDVYARFVREGIDRGELASAREYLKGQFAPGALETAPQAADLLLELQLAGLGPDLIDRFFQRLDALTLDQVNRVIKERFPREALCWVIIGRATELREVAAELGEVVEVELAEPGFGPGFPE